MVSILEYFDNKDIDKDEFLRICQRFLIEIDEVLILEEGNRIKVEKILINKIHYLSTYQNLSGLQDYFDSLNSIANYLKDITLCIWLDILEKDTTNLNFFTASWLYLHYSLEIRFYGFFRRFHPSTIPSNPEIKLRLIKEAKSFYYEEFTHRFVGCMNNPGTEMENVFDQYIEMVKFEISKSILPKIYIENKINELISETDLMKVKEFNSKNIQDFYVEDDFIESTDSLISESVHYFETEIPDKFIHFDDLKYFELLKYFMKAYTYLQSLYQEHFNKSYITQDDWLDQLYILNNRDEVEQIIKENKTYAPRYLLFAWLLHKNILKFKSPNLSTSALVDFKLRLSSVIKSRKSPVAGKEISTLKTYIKQTYPTTHPHNKTIYNNFLKKLEYKQSYKPAFTINLNNGISHEFFDHLHDKLLKEFIVVSKEDFKELFIIDPSPIGSIQDHLHFLFHDFLSE